MKKKLYLFITALLLMSIPSAWGDGTITHDNIVYSINGTNATVTKSPNATGNVIIPAQFTENGTTYNVIGVGENAFSGNKNITSVKFQSKVLDLSGRNIFSSCSNLQSIEFEEDCIGSKSIGDNFCQTCQKLVSIKIPEGVESIGYKAFTACKELKEIILPSTIKTLGSNKNAFFPPTTATYSLIINATTPPKVSTSTSTSLSNATIKVPATAVETYKADDFWKSYADNISAISTENIKITDLSQIDNNHAYTIVAPRGALVLNKAADNVTSSKTSDGSIINSNASTEAGADQWAIIKRSSDAEGYFLYNIKAKKFLKDDNTLSDNSASEFTLQKAKSPDGDYIFKFTSGANTLNNNNSGNFKFDDWSKEDGGNKLLITEVASINPISLDGVSIMINGIAYKLDDNAKTAYLTEVNQKCTLEDVVVPTTVNYGGNSYTVAGMIGQTFRGNNTIKNLKFESATLDYSQATQCFENMTSLTSLNFPAPASGTKSYLEVWAVAGCTSLQEIEFPEGITELKDVTTFNEASLTKMVLPSTLTKIGASCFAGSTFENKSGVIYSKAETAPEIAINENGYGGLKNATVVVPNEKAKESYQAAQCWKEAKNIITFDEYLAQFPFKFSTSYETAYWYEMIIRQDGRYCMYEDGNVWRANDTAPTDATLDKYLFAFVGTPFGFKIYNKSAGKRPFGKETNVTNDKGEGSADIKPTAEDNAATFVFEYFEKDGKTYKTLRYKDRNVHFNNLEGSGSSKIGSWVGVDGGSNFEFAEVNVPQEKDIAIDNIYYDLYSNGNASLTTTNQHCTLEDVTIPTSVEYNGRSYLVTDIQENAFKRAQIKSLTIKADNFVMGKYAFLDCKQLKSVVIDVANLDLSCEAAFQGCRELESVTFSDRTKATGLGDWTFILCEKLKSIILPEGMTRIGNHAFQGCQALKTLGVPSTLTEVGTVLPFSKWDGNGDYNYKLNAPQIETLILNAPALSNLGDADLSNCIVVVPGQTEKAHYETADASWNTAKAIITQNEKDILDNKTANGLVYVLETSTLVGDNIVKGETCANLVLTDGTNFTPAKAFTATNATYSRNAGNKKWGTICLPYAITETDNEGIRLFQIQSASNDALTVEEVTELPAGTPALIQKDETAADITLKASNAAIVTAPVEANNAGGVQLVGTFDRKAITDANTYYIKDNQFWGINKSFNVSAFRAYIKSANALSKGFTIVTDDDPTGINGVNTAENESEIVGIYTASGVKLNSLAKGINIVKYANGKSSKIIVK